MILRVLIGSASGEQASSQNGQKPVFHAYYSTLLLQFPTRRVELKITAVARRILHMLPDKSGVATTLTPA